MPETYTTGIRNYLSQLQDVLTKVDVGEIAAIADVLHTAYEQQKTVLVMGNGGSGSTASHMTSDMNKGACFHAKKKFRFLSLTDCTPLDAVAGQRRQFRVDLRRATEELRPAGRRGDRHLRQRQFAQRAAGHRVRQANWAA